MTPDQRRKYIQLGLRAHAATRSDDSFNDWRPGQVTAALQAVGRQPRRFKDFAEVDLDVMIAHFERVARGLPFDPAALLQAAIDGEKKRLRYVIERFKREYGQQAYWTILKGRFHVQFIEQLNLVGLDRLRMTLNARLNKYQTNQGKTPAAPENTSAAEQELPYA